VTIKGENSELGVNEKLGSLKFFGGNKVITTHLPDYSENATKIEGISLFQHQ
jgi:hypothetical protein